MRSPSYNKWKITMHAIVIKEWLKKSRFILIFSFLSSLALTALSLLRFQQNVSPIPEITQSGRGYPLIFLINTTHSLFETPLGLSVIFLNLVVDVVAWALIAFSVIVLIRIISA